MLISRKRANSFGRDAPQPSTMLNATDSAEVTICDFKVPRSLRGKLRTARRTLSTNLCALSHTTNRRKSCMATCSTSPPPTEISVSLEPTQIGSPSRTPHQHACTVQLLLAH